jgi:hypothetical protein
MTGRTGAAVWDRPNSSSWSGRRAPDAPDADGAADRDDWDDAGGGTGRREGRGRAWLEVLIAASSRRGFAVPGKL